MHFNPAALDAYVAPLDVLPTGLWVPATTAAVDRIDARLVGVARMREALIDGMVPPSWHPLVEPLIEKLCQLKLHAQSGRCEEVADQVLRALLWHADRIVDYRDRFGDDAMAAANRAAQAFADEWEQLGEDLEEIYRVFDALDGLIKFNRWDRTRGWLQSAEWDTLKRIRAMLEDLKPLRAVIERLGRAEPSDEADALYIPQACAVHETEPHYEPKAVMLPGAPSETSGVRRSAELARMLPGESALLMHRRLKWLWMQRLVEANLLTYEDSSQVCLPMLVEREVEHTTVREQPTKRETMGPLIVCVDTSGSMAGAPENVGKACVLEAMRIAHRQQRACYLYAFGGPGEVVERELLLDPDGIERLLEFMGQRFGGGTEVSDPIDRALERIATEAWQRADLILATDGEFGVTPDVGARLAEAKAGLGLRVQGILIGDRETIGLMQICDDIFWLDDWRRYAEGGRNVGSPVHTKGLTRQYFPGALTGVSNAADTRSAVRAFTGVDVSRGKGSS